MKYIYFVLLISTIISCKKYNFRANYKDVNSLIHATKDSLEKPYLKAHLRNGDVCIFGGSWEVDSVSKSVKGVGDVFDFKRSKISQGPISVLVDSVLIFETNTKLLNTENNRITALSILAGVDIVLGIYCITNPKACFGSCPTFYINENDNFHFADAEGFSNAIAPSLEYFDIDALNNKGTNSDTFSLIMKNEALETHCVNEVKLLAFPKKSNERVFQSVSNNFFKCDSVFPLSIASGNEGDITSYLQQEDRQERFSLADANNLNSKEEIYLTFNNIKEKKDVGLILNFRQTLMTTYFIYSAMGYMGDEVGDIFAKVEASKETKEKLNKGIKEELGNIDIYQWNEKKNVWEFQNGFYETGPIAANRQFIPLNSSFMEKTVKLKIVLNKGLWRLDYAALANITAEVKPIEIQPEIILNKGKIDTKAIAALKSPDKYLISMPGSEYKLNFKFPEKGTDYELFLYSKGYYLEWMRKHWLKDKDLLKLMQMVDYPKKYLKMEAKNYKLYELKMEQEFWNSKIDTKTFSYDEN